ncbi:hypothetical protein [Sulfurovum mangrovi]|uniref:hypothetical protein n=1 Tax=Sulfurovum mangrovi TaxID=2893889 RepID=UPI001E60801F|nr:hypothetical protein [Sulfurovum mangrovi]UFH59842.1 hypothetical protein LN246_03115 [Sulfurovum mangrovi]UFH59893.1 hypothetical protein LN246_03375 [Sulfurovum mangrovi]
MSMITVNGKLVKVDGTPYIDAVDFLLVDKFGRKTSATTIDGDAVVTAVSVTPDGETGQFSVDLYANTSLSKPTKYMVVAKNIIPFFVFIDGLLNPVDIHELDGTIPDFELPHDTFDYPVYLRKMPDGTVEWGFPTDDGTGDMRRDVYDPDGDGKISSSIVAFDSSAVDLDGEDVNAVILELLTRIKDLEDNRIADTLVCT